MSNYILLVDDDALMRRSLALILEQAGYRTSTAANAEDALRLARYFGTSPQFWMGLQNDYDLDVASDTLGDRLDVEVRPMVATG